mmetsp:Transcript_23937/g.49022  ORF Transcript_23937/g.49022 Transcript_23937/m.49022 type:complete len:202 (-) Transcript_23937:1250-1855(-)
MRMGSPTVSLKCLSATSYASSGAKSWNLSPFNHSTVSWSIAGFTSEGEGATRTFSATPPLSAFAVLAFSFESTTLPTPTPFGTPVPLPPPTTTAGANNSPQETMSGERFSQSKGLLPLPPLLLLLLLLLAAGRESAAASKESSTETIGDDIRSRCSEWQSSSSLPLSLLDSRRRRQRRPSSQNEDGGEGRVPWFLIPVLNT